MNTNIRIIQIIQIMDIRMRTLVTGQAQYISGDKTDQHQPIDRQVFNGHRDLGSPGL